MPSRRTDTEGLPTRVRWVVETGRVKSYRQWGRDAGIDERYPNQIASGAKTNPSADVLEALAAVAQVRIEWLRFGDGSPTSTQSWHPERDSDPNRAVVVAMARAKGEDDAVIQMLEETERAEGPMTLEEWEERLRVYRAMVKRNYDDPPDRVVVPDDDDTFGNGDK